MVESTNVTALTARPAAAKHFGGQETDNSPGNKDMWLPSPIYEWLPTSYVIIGVLFVSGALYIGLSAPFAPIYVGIGVASILVGFLVQHKRSIYRVHQQYRSTTRFKATASGRNSATAASE